MDDVGALRGLQRGIVPGFGARVKPPQFRRFLCARPASVNIHRRRDGVVASQTTQTTAPPPAERRHSMRATAICLLGIAACLNAGCGVMNYEYAPPNGASSSRDDLARPDHALLP